MGRQRTINDAEFWRSPRVADRSQEDKATLLYLLTSPYSNIIGVYQIVPRIAAAEMGWTADQLLTILKRLNSSDIALFDAESGFVWVKNWWDHNSAKMAIATTLRSKTLAQIGAMPASWRDEFLEDFLYRLPSNDSREPGDDLRLLIARELATRGHGVSIPYQQGSHTSAGNTNPNSNVISNSNTTHYSGDSLEFPTLDVDILSELQQIVQVLPSEIRQDVLDEIAAKMDAGTLGSPIALARHFAAHPDRFVLKDGYVIRQARRKRTHVQAELDAQAKRRMDELTLLDKNLLHLSEQQFLETYQNLPPTLINHLRMRREQLTSSST